MPKLPKHTRASQTRSYTVYFVPDKAARVYTAHVPALCIVTEGDTLADARVMVKDAIEGWIEAARQLGKAVPTDVTTERVEVCA
jgi:predicted RNase H-like HicB family nuclease